MEETTYAFKIHNQFHPTKPVSNFEITLSTDATVKDLCEVITQNTGIPRDSFVLSDFRTRKKIPMEGHDELDVSIATYFDSTKKNVLDLSRSENCKNIPEMKESYGSHETPDIRNPSPPKIEDTRKQTHTPSSQQSTFSYGPYASHYNYNAKSDTGFCGLSNQGATCYLNSLLQTLFMTPEFRSALYDWSFDEYCQRTFEKKLEALQSKLEADPKVEGESPDYDYEDYKKKTEDTLIPRQLQKLFLRLNTSDKRAVETKNLTKSFGWKSDDGFTQHDVQELCRVLFDALDTVWKGTDQSNLINELYQGEMQDYVQCLSCGNGSSRKDNFLDIPLVIKGFGATKAVGSIQEALEKFIEPETLSGDNQYQCDTCGKKCDARKGLKFNRFPYLLTLQLKRFDYDFNAHRRIKLNDRVTFPEILDMNPFLTSGNKGLTLSSRRRQMEIQKKKDNDGDTDDYDPEEANSSKEADDDDSEQSEISAAEQAKRKRQQTIALALKNGPYVYELFSVLIHRGSALGGHYYAYIRSFNTGKWYEFNDSSVKEIESSSLKETFGEDEKKYSQYSFFSGSGANAYMLMYRQYDPVHNEEEHTKDTIPESIKKLIEEEARLEEEKEQERIRQRDMVSFKFYYKDQTFEKKYMNTETMETVKTDVAKIFHLEHLLPDNLQLREYNMHLCYPRESIGDEQLKKPLSSLFYSYQTKPLLVETKESHEHFRKFSHSDLVCRIVYYNSDTKTWSYPEFVWISHPNRVKDLKEALFTKYGIPVEEQEISKDDYHKPKVLRNPNLDLRREIHDGFKLYLERKSDDPEKEPLAFQEIDRVKNTIEIYFSDPDEKEYKHKVTLDKRMTLLELKEIIEKTVKLSIDEFKVYRALEFTKNELRHEDEKLSECNLINGSKIAVEKGKPLRHGELPCKFYLYDLEKESKEELFQAALPGTLTIKEIKEEIIRHWKEIQSNDPKRANINLPNDPERLRLRDFFGFHKPYTVFMDNKTLKESVNSRSKYMTSSCDVHIQILPEGKKETKTSDDTVVIILRQFHPDKYELGSQWEFELYKDEKLGTFRDRVAAITGIPKISLAPADSYYLQNILNIPSLKWHPDPDEENSRYYSFHYYDKYDPSRLVRSLNLEDGDMLLYRDLNIPFKKLTYEEQKKIKDEEEKKRQIRNRAIAAQYSSRKEERLDIKIADVQLSQLSPTITKKT